SVQNTPGWSVLATRSESSFRVVSWTWPITWFELANVGHAACASAGSKPARTRATTATANVRLPISTNQGTSYGEPTNTPRPVHTWPSPTATGVSHRRATGFLRLLRAG